MADKKLLIVALLLLSLIPSVLRAADGDTFYAKTVEGYELKFKILSESEKTCQLGDGYYPCSYGHRTYGSNWPECVEVLTIPANPNGYKLTTIGTKAFYEEGLNVIRKIVVPKGVTEIKSSAFEFKQSYNMLDSLCTVVLPEGLQSIGDRVFAQRHRLANISLPEGLKTIGTGAFSSCDSLKYIRVPGSVENVDVAPFRMSGLEEVVFGEGIEDPLYLTDCTHLKKVTLPSTVTKIGYGCFSGCTSLEHIDLPAGVTTIESNAFKNCAITSITWPKSLTNLGSSVFEESGLKQVTLPLRLATLLSSGMFKNSRNLESVTYEEGYTTTGWSTFSGCSALKSVTLPSTITEIGWSCFMDCSSLETITLPQSVTKIGYQAFNNAGLKHVNLPLAVTEIMDKAFEGCPIDDLVIEKGRESIDGLLTSFTHMTKFQLPAFVTVIGSGLNGLGQLKELSVAPGNPVFDSRGNCNAIINSSTNILVRGCSATVIPKEVTTIGDNAFYGMKDVTEFTVPSHVTTIGNNSFKSSSIKRINLHNDIEAIGTAAFCASSLETFTLPPKVMNISRSMFASCSKLETVNLHDNCQGIGQSAFYNCSLKTLHIPYGLRYISYNAFQDSQIEDLVIPSSVESVGEKAFMGCKKIKNLVIESDNNMWFGQLAFYQTWIEHMTFLANCGIYNACGRTAFYPDEISGQAYFYAQLKSEFGGYSRTVWDIFIGLDHDWSPYYGSGANFSVPDGLEAYIVNDVKNGKAVLKRVNTINKDQGVLLHIADKNKVSKRIALSNGGELLRFETEMLDDADVEDYSAVNLLKVSSQGFKPYDIDMDNVSLFYFNGTDNFHINTDKYNEQYGLCAHLEVPKDMAGNLQDIGLSESIDVNNYPGAADVVALVNRLAGSAPAGFNEAAADVNKDGKVDIADIVTLVNLLFGK